MKRKRKKQWLDAIEVAAFVLQAVKFGMDLWEKRQQTPVRSKRKTARPTI